MKKSILNNGSLEAVINALDSLPVKNPNASALGKLSVEKRMGGKTKEEKSKYMSDVRKGKTPKK